MHHAFSPQEFLSRQLEMISNEVLPIPLAALKVVAHEVVSLLFADSR